MEVLAAADLEHFIELGWCRVPAAFSADDAAAAVGDLWARMAGKRGIARDRPDTWPPAYDIEEHLDTPAVLRCFTDRLSAAIEQLVGPGRWIGARRWGLWPVNFAFGAREPDAVPSFGWHVDGNWFRHTLDCPRQGLLVIGLFTDVAPGGGGTVLAERSHRRTARVLAEHPAGLTHTELFDRVLAEPLGDFCELTGAAGDAILAHPFLFHTRGFKRGGPPRVLSNTEAPLREPMRPHAPSAPVEHAIARALATAADPPPAGALRCRF